MSRARRRAPEAEEHPDERWLVSYADMITVLMILFIMLYAISSVNVSKYKALQSSTAEALGADPEGIVDPQGPEKLASDTKPTAKEKPVAEREKVTRRVKEELAKAGLSHKVSVTGESRGVVMRFADQVLFPTASARLTSDGSTLLTKLKPALNVTHRPLVIEGHTDNRPIRTAQYPSNWELSTGRSAAVLHQLHAKGIPANRLSAAGYAHTRPRGSNTTTPGRASNRRVEIVIQMPQQHAPAPTGSGAQP